MSTLNITALTPTGGTRVPVKIQLCDSNRRPISAYTSGGILVSTYEGRTNSSGVLSIDIPANTTGILTSGGTPLANTYYLVTVGPFTRLIRKTTSTQTLAAAEVTSTEELDPAPSLNSLTDVDTATTPPTNGQALVYNTSSGLWLPGTISAGTVDVVSNVASSRVLGRVTAGSGDSEELTATQVRTLINVEDGATADQTAAEILAALLTVDGSGSGLDADTLDGHDTAYFQTALGYTAENTANKDIDGTLAANSDTKYPSQKATKTYVDAEASARASAITALSGTYVPKATFPVLIGVAMSDETTAITTGTAKVTMRAPFAFTLTAVRASLTTASSSGIPTVDINETGTTVLSTKLTIDANELTSTTAATAAVISDSSIADDAELTFDVDVAGTGAKGLKVWLIGTRAL